MSTLAETLASPAVLCKALRMNDQMLEAGARAKPQRPSIEPLTSLRAFAAIYVLVFHSGTQYLVKGKLVSGPLATFLLNGYIGVNFFFVLSGFILQYIYGRRLQTRNDVAEYGIARFARVYPVYLLALILTCLFVFDATLSAVPQFLLLQSWSSPAIGQPDNWNTPGWTLSVELLFYILFPVITLKVRELGATTLVISAIFICFFMMVMRSPAHPGIQQSNCPSHGSSLYPSH
jgi:peptidoglycan/LPS O-acetylase OafA/YrhL